MQPVTLTLTAPGPALSLATPDQLHGALRRLSQLKGRQIDDTSMRELRALIGPPPPGGHRRDLLIEHLHLLNDH